MTQSMTTLVTRRVSNVRCSFPLPLRPLCLSYSWISYLFHTSVGMWSLAAMPRAYYTGVCRARR